MKALLFVFIMLLRFVAYDASYKFKLPPTVYNGQFVGKVGATDPDAGQTLTWSIVDGNTNYKAFRIDEKNGDIFVHNATFVNTRKKLEFFLTVRVTDSGGRNSNNKFVKLSAQAIIHITRSK